MTTIENLMCEIHFRFSRIQTYRMSYFLRRSFAKHQTLSSYSVGFSVAGLDHTKFSFYQFQSFLFIVVIVISILLKTTFLQISFHRQLLVKIL